MSMPTQLNEAGNPESADFSRHAVGISAIVLGAIVLALLCYFLFTVVAPLASETRLSQQLTAFHVETAKSDKPVDENTLRFLINLEYAAATIRTVNVQITFAMVGGLFLICVGVLIFAAGIVAPFDASAQGAIGAITLKNSAPGMVAAIMGAIVLALGVIKNVPTGSFSYEHSRPSEAFNKPRQAARITDHEVPKDSWYSNEKSIPGDRNAP